MTKPNACVAVLVFCCAPCLPAFAHETGIYESLEHIHIGRVFLSPTAREYLDKNRNITSPPAGASGNAKGDQKAVPNDRAAGYIVSSSGHTRVWRDGDFVAVDTPSAVRFPGDVKVSRAADTAPDTADSEHESSTAGAADDAE